MSYRGSPQLESRVRTTPIKASAAYVVFQDLSLFFCILSINFNFFEKKLQIKTKAILTISNKLKMNKANHFSSSSSVMSLFVLGGE